MSAATQPADRVVLVVDDDAVVLKSLGRALLPLPATLHLADSGEAALAWLEAGGVPAVVLTDLNMGAVSGLDVLAAVRRWAPGAFCMLHTGAPCPDLDPDLTVLPKPTPAEDIRRKVLEALRG